MVIKILSILVASVLSGILYRMGGSSKFNTKFRDAGCPLVFLLLIWILFGFHLKFWWAYLLTFGLSWAALTTYLDSIFGYDNFYAHGFICGLAGIPLNLARGAIIVNTYKDCCMHSRYGVME